MIHYFVDQKGLLKRRVFGVGGGVGFTDGIIAEHVKNLQFRYDLLPDSSGRMRQPVTTLATTEEQGAVRQVEVSVTTETVHTVNNGKRQDLSATTRTSLRNLQFREALQPSSSN